MYPNSTADATVSIAQLSAENIVRAYSLPRRACKYCRALIILALSLDYEPGEFPKPIALNPRPATREQYALGSCYVIAAWSRTQPPFVVLYDFNPEDDDEPIYRAHRCGATS